jgi:hypothetical protein
VHANRLSVITAVVVGCVLVSLPAASQIHQTQPVLVVNGSGAPVPTVAQGTTNVAGTVNLSSGSTVNVGNTPNVNIANNATVTVANTPTVSLAPGAAVSVSNPLDAQNNPTPLAVLEAVQPYESVCEIRAPIDPDGVCALQAVPSGKRLVVEELDAWFIVETGIKPIQTDLYTTVPHFFPMTLVASGIDGGTDDAFATHQATRLYFTGPGAINCSILLSQPSFSGSFTCGVSGFLVDVH